MEDKLKKLRSAMDESAFKNGEFSDEAKNEVHRKIEEQQQPSSRWAPWMKPAFSTAVCLVFLLASLYAFNHKSMLGSFPYPQLLSKQQGKLTLLYVGKKNPLQFDKVSQRFISQKKQISLETAERKYGKLHIDQTPSYIFLNSKGVAFRSGDWRKVGQFVYNYVKKKTGFPYPQFLSSQKGKYQLFVAVSAKRNSYKEPKIAQQPDDFKLLTSVSINPIKKGGSDYPKLHIPNKRPYYIFLDTHGIAYRTGSKQEAGQFIQSKLQPIMSKYHQQFQQVLDRAQVPNTKVLKVIKYDANLDGNENSAFVIYQTAGDQAAVGNLQKTDGKWEWVQNSQHVIQSADEVLQLSGKGPVKLICGVHNANVAKVKIDQTEADSISLDSGKTFWYRKSESAKIVKAYKKDGSVAFAKPLKRQKKVSFKAFNQNDQLSTFTKFSLNANEKRQIEGELKKLGTKDIKGNSFVPTVVPAGTKLVTIKSDQNHSHYYGPRGPFLVLKFTTFKISVQVPQLSHFRPKGAGIKSIAIQRRKADWYKRTDDGGTHYDLEIFEKKRLVTLSSPLKKISHADIEKVANGLKPF